MVDPVKQVEHEISPVVAFKTIGLEAEIATVPLALGTVSVLVVPVAIVESCKASFLVVSDSS